MRLSKQTKCPALMCLCAAFFVMCFTALDAAAQKPSPKPDTSAGTSSTTPAKITPAVTYIYGWARVVTTVQDLDKNYANLINRAYYSNILALPKGTDETALKSQVTTYFTQLGLPYAMKVNEKLQVKDVMVKTFPTLVEADNARYAMATQDEEKLNANATTEVPLPVSYFTWNYYGSRRDLFPKLSEFVTTGRDPQWEFVTFEVNVEKQVGGEEMHETRYYVSYPYELFMDGSESINEKKHLDEYFTKTVVEPTERRGVKFSYYDDAIEVSPASYAYKTFAEAWAAREEKISGIRENGYPRYDFLVISQGPNKGEATSFPFCAMTCTGERARITASEPQRSKN